MELPDGETVAARRVIANVNPKLLFGKLVAPEHLDADFRARIDGYRCGSGTFRMNVALAELPDFQCLPGTSAQPHHGSGIIVAPSLGYMERAFFDAKTLGWSREPIVEMLIPSVVDDSLAPPGMHVASLFCQHANPRIGDVLPGHTWDDHRNEVADLMIDTVDRVAPNFARSVLGRRVLSPLDLEREFGLTGGDIFHGALALDQLFSARPVLGNADYRMPVRGSLSVRVRCASGRRRDRHTGPQCGARNPEGCASRKKTRSRPISRVLLRRALLRLRAMTAILLGPPLPMGSSRLPADSASSVVVRLFGVAPDGGCRVSPASGNRKRLVSVALFLAFANGREASAPAAGRYPASCSAEPGLSSPPRVASRGSDGLAGFAATL